jgi:hypothetical protein
VDSSKSSGAQTLEARTVVLTMPKLQPSRLLIPAMPAVDALSHGRPRTVSNWRRKGEVCRQGTLMAAATAQGGRIAGQGASDVTDIKFFSTRLGPPTCSPPV